MDSISEITISSISNNIYSNSKNNILTTPDFEGVGYAPTFDYLFVYGRDQVKSENMEELLFWCHERVVDCWCKLKDYWNVSMYKQQLEDSEKQVEELEKKLKESEERAAALTKSAATVHTPSTTVHTPSTTVHTPSTTVHTPSTSTVIPKPPVAPFLTLSSLPPPPPPPLPPMVNLPISQKLNIVSKKSNSLKQEESNLFITPEALNSIHLKKAKDRKTPIKDPNTPGLVTLDALKSISLRRTQSAKSLDDVGKENLHQILAHELINRRALKKTTIRRSPGGTPLSDKKRKRDNGQGLTPMMTRALKRKFRLAKRESLSSDDGGYSNSSSPDMFCCPDLSFCNQTINTSPGDLSWGSSPNNSLSDLSSFTRDRRSSPLLERTNIMESPLNLSTSSPHN